MVSVLASSVGVVDRGFELRSDQTKDNKIDICCFSTKHTTLGVRPKTDYLGITIICPSGATCLPADYCFSAITL